MYYHFSIIVHCVVYCIVQVLLCVTDPSIQLVQTVVVEF